MLSCVPQAWGTFFYGPVCVRVRPFWRRRCYGLGRNMSWSSHSAQNCSRNIEYRKIQRRYSLFYRSVIFVMTFWTKITSVFFLGRHYHRIFHQLNIYGINSVDMFATVKIHRKHYRSCVTHLCTSETTSHKPLSNDWLVLCVGDAKLSLLQEVVGHTRYWTPQTSILHDNFCLSIICWNLLILPYLLCPYESKLYDFVDFFFSM